MIHESHPTRRHNIDGKATDYCMQYWLKQIYHCKGEAMIIAKATEPSRHRSNEKRLELDIARIISVVIIYFAYFGLFIKSRIEADTRGVEIIRART